MRDDGSRPRGEQIRLDLWRLIGYAIYHPDTGSELLQLIDHLGLDLLQPGQESRFLIDALRRCLAAGSLGLQDFDVAYYAAGGRSASTVPVVAEYGVEPGGIRVIMDRLAHACRVRGLRNEMVIWAQRLEQQQFAEGALREDADQTFRQFITAATRTSRSEQGVHGREVAEIVADISAPEATPWGAEWEQRIRFGIENLDEEIFMRPGDLVEIVGLSKCGKTRAAASIMAASAERGALGYVQSLEMDREGMTALLLSHWIDMDSELVGRGHPPAEVTEAVAHYADAIAAMKVHINAERRMTAEQVAMSIRAWRWANPGEGAMAMVDYLQILDAGDRGDDNRAYQLRDDAYMFKELAQELGIVVVLTCQLNSKAQAERINSTQHIEGSGGIRQAADICIAVDYPFFRHDQESDWNLPHMTPIPWNVTRRRGRSRIYWTMADMRTGRYSRINKWNADHQEVYGAMTAALDRKFRRQGGARS